MTRLISDGLLGVGDVVHCSIKGRKYLWDVFEVRTETTDVGFEQTVLASRKGQGSARFRWVVRCGEYHYVPLAFCGTSPRFHLHKRASKA